VPSLGFHFVNWSDASTDNPRTDTNASADLDVTANFDFDAVSYTTGTEVPLSVNAFIAAGSTVDFTLNYAPTPGTQLMVVEQTGPGFIEGTFDNLANGAAVDLTFGGTIYHFVAWYYGGDGNDLVLLWRDTGLAAWGNDQVVPSAVPQSGVLAGKLVSSLAGGGAHSLALYADPIPPEIAVAQPAETFLTDGSASIDFAAAAPGGSAVERTFTVRNFGSGDLTGLSITIDGTDAADFSITAAVAPVVAPGGSTTFTVSFAPSSLGAKTAAMHLASNDSDESPFDIALTGISLTPLETWRQTWFGSTATNAGNAADSADPYETGVPNLLVFAFFGPDQDPATVQLNQLPQPTSAGGILSYQFTEPAGVSGIIYGAEWSATLGDDWLPVADTGTAPDHIFSVPMDIDRKFLRLTVD